MSSENFHTEALAEEGPGEIDKKANVCSSDQNQGQVPTGDSTLTLARDTVLQQAAASTLLQLHNRETPQVAYSDSETLRNNTSRFGSRRSNEVDTSARLVSRPWESMAYGSSNMSQPLESMNMTQNSFMYSQPNMQNTMAGLTNAIGNLQQEHLTMHSRQENITGTLTQVLSVLQDIKDGNQTNALHQTSATNMQNESSIPHPLRTSTSIDRYPGSTSEVSQRNHIPFSRDQWHSAASHASSSIDTGFAPYVSSIGGALDANQSGTSRYQEGRYSQAHIDLQPAEVEADHQAMHYRTEHEGMGSSQTQSNNNQMYTGFYNEGGRSRVTFNDTPRYASCTNQVGNLGYGQMYETGDSRSLGRTSNSSRSVTKRNSEWYDLKIPPFNGKEDWKTWINRFEAIAERRNWSEECKLDNILPKLQGKAGDFVFSQLSKHTLSCYRELIKELNSRFRVVETEKSFAAKFSQRCQRADETVEEFAADLKRLYAKAYKNRDCRTKQEDLVRRFLDGMRDNEARFEIEYHKEPDDIDEAVYHAVNFIHTRRRNSQDTHERRFKKYARRTSLELDSPSDDEENFESDEDDIRALRVPAKTDKTLPKKTNRSNTQGEQGKVEATGPSDSMKMITETRELLQTLVSQLTNKESSDTGKKYQQQANAGFSRRGKIQCYACQEFGHMARECPTKLGKPGPNIGYGRGNIPSPNQGQMETRRNPLN